MNPPENGPLNKTANGIAPAPPRNPIGNTAVNIRDVGRRATIAINNGIRKSPLARDAHLRIFRDPRATNGIPWGRGGDAIDIPVQWAIFRRVHSKISSL